MVRGIVKGGQRFEHKVPTANIEMLAPGLPVGVWFGVAWHRERKLGPCACWVLPHQPGVCEVYVAEWEGDLYGEELEVRDLRVVSKDEMKQLYDRALSDE